MTSFKWMDLFLNLQMSFPLISILYDELFHPDTVELALSSKTEFPVTCSLLFDINICNENFNIH